MKDLNQKNFNFEIVQDLGMLFATKNSKTKKRYGLFRCPKCTNITKMPVQSAKKANKCVGCRNLDNSLSPVIHGDSGKRLNIIYKNMLSRCFNFTSPAAKDYSERGIKVCNTWVSSYMLFRQWALENGYAPNLMLDRRDNNLGYTPDNCRWVTRTVQNRNKRKIMSTNTTGYRGVTKTSQSDSFTASISVNNKKIHIGCFFTKENAAKAYDEYVLNNKLEHTINGV